MQIFDIFLSPKHLYFCEYCNLIFAMFVLVGCVTDLKSHTESYFLESSTAFFCLITAFVCLLRELSLLSELHLVALIK